MTGLEKILKHIEEEALKSANDILGEAKDKEKQILAEAKEEGARRCAEIDKKSSEEVANILSRAKSAAELEERRLVLRAKQEAIENILTKSMEELLQVPSEQYFDILIAMIKKYAAPLAGQIILSETDRKRLPNNFEAKVAEALSDKVGASLTISEETREISGGFILSYENVEENCSFDALFLAEKENLIDKVSALLFS